MNIYKLAGIAVAMAMAMAGCSSAPKQTSQFCHTSKTIQVQDGSSVSSKTMVICSDDPVERIVMKQAGIASSCGEFKYWTTLKGQPVERSSYACKKFDGTWEVVPGVVR